MKSKKHPTPFEVSNSLTGPTYCAFDSNLGLAKPVHFNCHSWAQYKEVPSHHVNAIQTNLFFSEIRSDYRAGSLRGPLDGSGGLNGPGVNALAPFKVHSSNAGIYIYMLSRCPA